MPYGLTAVTLEPSRICAIPKDAFLDLVGHSPPLALELLRRLAVRSRLNEEQLVDRARLPVAARIARLLLGVHRHGGAARKGSSPEASAISREELALLIGTTRETLSRTLHEFAGKGLLELSASAIRVLDPDGLRRIADR